MAEAVLQFESHREDLLTPQQDRLTTVLPELEEDRLTRHRAAKFIGACLLDNEITYSETASSVRPIESLYDALQQVQEGSQDALGMIETNVRTDVIERTLKTGHVIKVDLMVDEAGKIQQFGQSMETIQANSLKMASANPEMRKRTEAETLNSFRIEEQYRKGSLDDHYFVVFSRAADDMSLNDMKEVGFFTETMSCSIQVTTCEDGRPTTESAFVSGTKTSGADRHDQVTIAKVGEELGADLKDKGATETIATPILVHKDLMPNGVIDLVELYDKSAGGTFFGEDRPTEDYIKYKEKCLDKEKNLQPTVEKIVKELIDEAPGIYSPLHAVTRLHKLSEKHMVNRAVTDQSIDARVFGQIAQMHIENARIAFQNGSYDQAEMHIGIAVKTAVSSSCPSSMNSSKESSNSNTSGKDKYGSLEFTCPKCSHTNKRPEGKLIKNCQSCDADVTC